MASIDLLVENETEKNEKNEKKNKFTNLMFRR